jgi:hypothetical protein
MKIRHGFVSNSSSASFIVVWKCLDPNIDNAKDALAKITLDDSILERTQKLKSNAYRTVFFTTMFNEYEDFGPEAAFMIMNLYVDNNFEIIDARVEADS